MDTTHHSAFSQELGDSGRLRGLVSGLPGQGTPQSSGGAELWGGLPPPPRLVSELFRNGGHSGSDCGWIPPWREWKTEGK